MAASAAFAVNVGLLQHDDTKPVGVLNTSAIESTFATDPADPTVVTVIVEDPPLQSDVSADASADPAGASDLAPALEQGDDRDDDSTEIEHDDDD